jgi:cysteine synthase
MVHQNILTLIGNTPMVRISKLASRDGAKIFAKLESYNIGGSLKDRMVLYAIEDAERNGRLSKDKVLLEASSGNTGIAMAMIAGVKGYKVAIVIPESVSVERRKLIKAYGAELILSPGEKGTGGAVELKNELLTRNPEKYVNLDQFKNPINVLAHYETTAVEILEQTQGRVNIVVVGIGTAGTGVGVSKRLKKYNSRIKIVGVMPKLGTVVQGLRNPEELNPTQLFNSGAFDEIIEISDELKKNVFQVSRNLARKEGILAGMSSGAVMYVALKKAQELDSNKMIVAILPDTGERYLSTDLFEQ